MNLINYIGRRVKITLINDYYYIGKVVNADENSLDMIDFKNQNVALKKESIATIQEIGL
jgi:hypothetical protein